MKIETNRPTYFGKSIRFGNELVKFNNKGEAEVKDDKIAENILKNMKGFFKEGERERLKSKNDIKVEQFTGEVQQEYLKEIDSLKASNKSLQDQVEKLKVSEKKWREEYQKLAETKVVDKKKEEDQKEKPEEVKKDGDDELMEMLSKMKKDELISFAEENGITREEIGQKREKGIIELILAKYNA